MWTFTLKINKTKQNSVYKAETEEHFPLEAILCVTQTDGNRWELCSYVE